MNPDDHPYEQSVVIHASPAVVFRALTNATELQKWFPTRATSEPRTGGPLTFAWDFADATHNGTQDSHFVDFTPNSQVSYIWDVGQTNPKQTLVTFTLQPTGDETTVSLAHTGFGPGAEGEQQRDFHAGPWSFYIANLKTYLETGTDNRAAALGQKTG